MVGPTLCVPFKAACFNNNCFPLHGGGLDTMTKTHTLLSHRQETGILLAMGWIPSWLCLLLIQCILTLYTCPSSPDSLVHTQHSVFQQTEHICWSYKGATLPNFCFLCPPGAGCFSLWRYEMGVFSFLWIINRIMKAKKNITGSCHWSWHLLSRSKIMLKKSICFVKLSIFLIHLQKIISSYIYISLLNFI